jgi:phosphoribosyl-AMP cyclohydrolase
LGEKKKKKMGSFERCFEGRRIRRVRKWIFSKNVEEVKMLRDFDFFSMHGILPVIIQDVKSGEVIRMVFFNRASWERTLKTREVTFVVRDEMCVLGKYSVKKIFYSNEGESFLIQVEPEKGFPVLSHFINEVGGKW